MTSVVKAEINNLIAARKHCGVLLRFENGKIFNVLNHWAYLDFDKAPKVLIAKGTPPPKQFLVKGKFWYVTEPLK
jgi:hypothetical protein